MSWLRVLHCALSQDLADAGYVLAMHYQYFESRDADALSAHQAAAKLGHRQSLFRLYQVF